MALFDSTCFDSISKLLCVRNSNSSCAICERVAASFSRLGSAGGAAGIGACWKKDCLIPVEPEPWDWRDLKTLLRRCALCSKFGADDSGAGV